MSGPVSPPMLSRRSLLAAAGAVPLLAAAQSIAQPAPAQTRGPGPAAAAPPESLTSNEQAIVAE